MSNETTGPEPTSHELLIMATHLHGSTKEIVDGHFPPTANGHVILKQAMIWMGKWSDACADELRDQLYFQLYQSLIDLANLDYAERLMVGFGNLHHDPAKRTDPIFVSFGATEQGHAAARELFSRHPQLACFKEVEGPCDRLGRISKILPSPGF